LRNANSLLAAFGTAAALFVVGACQKATPEPKETANSSARTVRPAPAPPQAPASGAVRFAVIGDFGSAGQHEAAVARLIKGWRPDFVITTGDDNYPAGGEDTIDANIGQYYSDFIGNYRGAFGPGSPVNRFWPTPGNHDWYADGLEPYLRYFTLPGNERYYDVPLGLVHLFALDSDPHEPDGTTASSAQAGWLKQRLGASKACHRIVYFHHPPYSSASHGPTAEMRWPFREWGADVVLTGHDHTYERLEANGIPYFVVGISGSSKYPFGTPAPESRVRFNADYGALLVTADTNGIKYEFVTADGKKIDELAVSKQCTAKEHGR
jgi:tartrate-resistant acid phosphatase type 5